MKIYIIILINTLFFSIKVYSNSLNSLEMFLPKDNIEYEDHTESDLPVKSRYEKIEGDLNIFPSKNYFKIKNNLIITMSKIFLINVIFLHIITIIL